MSEGVGLLWFIVSFIVCGKMDWIWLFSEINKMGKILFKVLRKGRDWGFVVKCKILIKILGKYVVILKNGI